MKKITVVMTVFLALLVGVGVGWAGHTILTPPPEVAQVAQFSVVTAEDGSVSASARTTGAAIWERNPNGVNNATGVVTEIKMSGRTQVTACDVLYLVNESPVVIAQGEIPAFRSLGSTSKGRDVAQLQQMLHECKFLATNGDGVYGPATVRAVKAWQESLGVRQSGTVDLGSVIFVSNLPTQIVLDESKVAVGQPLSGGEIVLASLDQAPAFYSSFTGRQVEALAPGMAAVISSNAGEFNAIIKEIKYDEDNSLYEATYGPVGDQPICGDQCDQFSVDSPTRVEVEIITIAPTHGVVVPLAALGTSVNGEQVVRTEVGDRVPVQVVMRARGQAVVEGISAGTKVRVPEDVKAPEKPGFEPSTDPESDPQLPQTIDGDPSSTDSEQDE